MPRDFEGRGCGEGGYAVIDLTYSIVIEATSDPNFFSFYSPDLPGFTGVGHSVEECLSKATVVIHNEQSA